MSEDDLMVRGGSHGIAVAIDELTQAAAGIAAAARSLAREARFVGGSIGDPIRSEVARGVRETFANPTGAQHLWRHAAFVALQARVLESVAELLGCSTAATELAADLHGVGAAYATAESINAQAIAAARVVVAQVADGLQAAFDLDETGRTGTVTPQRVGEGTAGPGLAGLLAQQQAIDDGRRTPGEIRVAQRRNEDGSSTWTVFIPGTQDWSRQVGTNPADSTTNLAAMSGELTVAQQGVADALQLAQRAAGRAGAGDPVMLVGHSQGGIIAVALASNAAFVRSRNVRSVVAVASPISGFRVDPTVAVMSISHRQDVVPKLDLAADPGRANWVSVTRALPSEPTPPARRLAGPMIAAGPGPRVAHSSDTYLETLHRIDRRIETQRSRGQDSSLTDWADDNARFLGGGEQTVRDYRIERVGNRDSGVTESGR